MDPATLRAPLEARASLCFPNMTAHNVRSQTVPLKLLPAPQHTYPGKTSQERQTQVLFGKGLSYLNGAPDDTCLTMFPKHGLQTQLTNSPFDILTSSSTYAPGQNISVTLRSNTNGRTFTGLQIRAYPTVGDTELIVGQFLQWPTNKTKVINCLGGRQNMITHTNNIPVSDVYLTWQAPNTSYGQIAFVVTFLENFQTFWINQKAYINTTVPATNGPAEKVEPNFHVMDWSQCGKERGCFLYPQPCTGYNCYAGVTYKTVNQTVEFEMFVNEEGYVSVGFSEDKIMGEEETITCTTGDLNIGFQRGYNHEPKYNERQSKAGLVSLQGQYVDGRLYCRFSRPLEFSISVYGQPKTINLNDDFYLMLAWGPVYQGSDVIGIHKALPPITYNKVDFQSNKIVRGSSLPITYQIHGMLMLIAWILFVGVVTIIARYFKTGFGSKMVCGVKSWFQIHRAMAISVWLFTAASFILIFVVLEGMPEKTHAHHFLGIVVMAASTLQVLAGLLRPGLDSKFRPAFNIGHWLFGKGTHILAAITFYFAYQQEIVPEPQRQFAYIVLSVWLVAQICWEGLFELNELCRKRKHYDSYNMSPMDKGSQLQPDSKFSNHDDVPCLTKWLLLYVLSLIAICVAALCSIFLF